MNSITNGDVIGSNVVNGSISNSTVTAQGQAASNHPVFDDMRKALPAVADPRERTALEGKIAEMERSRGQPGFKAAYKEFMSLASNHVTVFGVFVAALSQFL